ncbi:helix-turn-helix transcriptional regulator [Saccharopolyspora shandongensis]|uniref:helix-turn-helix domain-containing protein n=1 Tax=Saccharopolyspora shandongensis TaxID=418495 RepID=UPI0034145220
MGRNAGGTPKARALGAELREARNAAGLTIRQLAAKIESNNAKLSRFETGQRVPAPEDVASILQALNVTGSERDRILAIARDAGEANWLSPGLPTYQQDLTTFMEFERTATKVFEVCPNVLPGLLQTRDYARAVMAGMSNAEIETRVTLRVGRREVLDQTEEPKFTIVIGEGALQEPLGGKKVLAEQLRYIVRMSEKPSLVIQVLPSGATAWHAAHAGAFFLYEFEKAPPIVHLEHYASSSFLYTSKSVEPYRGAATSLRELALGPDDSIRLIEKCIAEIEESL